MITPFWVFFSIIVGGYILQSLTLLLIFYYRRSNDKTRWKSQPNEGNVGIIWLPPLISNKPNRAPNHRLVTTTNLIVAGIFAGTVAELITRGYSRINSSKPLMALDTFDWMRIVLIEVAICVLYESVVEYYWHRLMHTEAFYKTCHKMHHHYKSPEVYDDMYIHPLEAIGYYCILYAPPFLFPITLPSFILYMVIMGLCGVCDHSGVKMCIKGVYSARDHDLHHELFNVNYSFPFIFMDVVHGTYRDPDIKFSCKGE